MALHLFSVGGTLQDGAATRHPHGSPGRSSWLHGPFSWKLPCPSSAVQARDTFGQGLDTCGPAACMAGSWEQAPMFPYRFPLIWTCAAGGRRRGHQWVPDARQPAADGRPQFLILQNGTTGQAPAPNPPPAPPLGLHCEVLSHFSGLSGESLPPQPPGHKGSAAPPQAPSSSCGQVSPLPWTSPFSGFHS